jgi:glucosamine--fructose-6-phosphate aminotransferase (isomerizing)
MISNIEEVKARKAPVYAFGTKSDSHLASLADVFVAMPSVHPIVQPVVTTVYLHLLAYYVGVAKGLNVDRPRNLAKSVTVE